MARPFSFDDIRFWVGSGANRAAMVIDWSDQSTEPPALAWGYRWDGAARGRDMLLAIVTADSRLFAKLGGAPGSPNAVFGLGYDANNDGQFGIDDDTTFDVAGIAYSGPADGAVATDSADYYAEGWFMGFWHYGVAPNNPYDSGTWSDIPVGMGGRVLSDGAWDSWTFTPTFNFSSFAENPTAALPPTGPGDFNDDGDVDLEDFDAWHGAFGSTADLAADANGDSVVDSADYVVWRKHYEPSAGSAAESAASAPEPTQFAAGVMAFLARLTIPFRKRKEIE